MITVVPSRDVLLDLLEGMNDDGRVPEVAGVDATGSPFLAALTDPDGELAMHVPTERGTMPCAECTPDSDALGWLPNYPVRVLGWFPVPDTEGEPAATPVESTICPECAPGKCGNCDGSSWSNVLDGPVECSCAARGHKPPVPGVTS